MKIITHTALIYGFIVEILFSIIPASSSFSSKLSCTPSKTIRQEISSLSVLDYSPNGEVVNGDVMTMENGEQRAEVNLIDVLCTCVRAAQVGCNEIRRVHSRLDRTKDGSINDDIGSRKVDYKIENDPRSALTAADLAAQAAIIGVLQTELGSEIKIVGEEDMACAIDESDAAGGAVCASELVWSRNESTKSLNIDQQKELEQLKEKLNASLDDNDELPLVQMDDITIFVDPLDGTREFVEGRIQNVQTLVGISVRGLAVAGAIGLPFSMTSDGKISDTPVVVCALDGAGPPRAVFNSNQNRAESDNPIHGGGRPEENERPLLVCGDVNDPALEDAYAAAVSKGGRSVLLGGTGQKCLAVSEGRADIAIMNFKSSAWDTCAPEALVRASGGKVTDIFGERLLHCSDPQSPHDTFLNNCGVIASSSSFSESHDEICQTLRRSSNAQDRLKIWGLEKEEDGAVDDATIQSILDRRREHLKKGI